ncbi:ArnT family glycosyltransferase [Polluticoccus soli]|uniref:ArnT family glycosyltransferase n=1 Tax=Polluticoccus soli TaxID=3034150 RepID=UPI0023E125DC|nr:glycosyltransferase family 39 protein [Flavipsychrobacter sp. JY13-12]
MPVSFRYLIIIIAGSLLFFPFLGHVHLFDWDEINFAECAREMIVSHDYLRMQIDFQPFWEKPPLFIWMQVLAMKLFGVNEYAARFPNAFIGVVTLVTLYYAGKRVIGDRLATWWTVIYAATWLPHFYFKSGIIDPLFNLLIFLAFFQVYLLRYENRKSLHAILAGLFLGLAVLTKGPVAILIALLAFGVYVVVNKGLWGYKIGYLLLIALSAFVTTSLWFGIEAINHGWWFVSEFITYQVRLFQTEDAGHGGPFFYHFIILFIGCFPASMFLFQFSRKRSTTSEPARDFTRWMWILFWVVLILFSIVKTKIVHYSSLCYFPLTYLAALQLYRLSNERIDISKGVQALLLTIGSILGIAIASLPIVGINKAKLIPLIDDPFAVGNLQANVPWSYVECIWGILYLVGIWVSVMMMRRNFRIGMVVLAVVQIVIIQVTVLHFTPKIEAISQRAAIEYFKSFQGKDVYVKVLGYKSYAHLFYTKKQPPINENSYNEEWLLTGPVDKPTYFICKIMDADRYRAMPQLQQIGEKNGFVFFRRK